MMSWRSKTLVKQRRRTRCVTGLVRAARHCRPLAVPDFRDQKSSVSRGANA